MPTSKHTHSARLFRRKGVTLLEIILVVIIIVLLILFYSFTVPPHFQRTRDEQRKSDLDRLKIALEDYAGDNNCYPEPARLNTCAFDTLNPYLARMVCEPRTNVPYVYVRSADCLSFALFTTLEREDDEAIAQTGCQNGCGPNFNGSTNPGAFNYGVVGGDATLEDFTGNVPVEVAPLCAGGTYCIPNGNCGACCPGANYRCNSTGTGCIQDATCENGLD